MISRIRSALTFLVLVGGMLTLGAEDCIAQPPPEVDFSVEEYRAEAEAAWARYLQEMEEEFGEMEEFEGNPGPPNLMVRAWGHFLEDFARDVPFSGRDEELRDRATERLEYWQATSPQGRARPRDEFEEPAESLDVCLDHLNSSGQPSVGDGLRLGRIFQNEEVVEPVLIRKNATGYSFRRCSGGRPTEVMVAEADLEFFNSALVARFDQEKTEALTIYRETSDYRYEEDGETEFTFRGAGRMLEARRLGDDYVEVTIFPPKRITILLIATRTAMKKMEPRVWEESWGSRPEDSRIEREIIWWELASPTDLRVHPTVGSFAELEGFLGNETALGTETNRNVGIETDWSHVLNLNPKKGKVRGVENLKTILARDVLSLFIVEEPEHIGLAQAMREQAVTNSDTELDVATLESRWNNDQKQLLEEAASWGRYLPLVRLYGLTAIMPDRIAGKIRRKYHQSTESKGDYVTLAIESPEYQVANAVFQDQAAGMGRVISFLVCLLETSAGAPSRREILVRGFERMNIRAERLEEMDVSRAFHYLFQGFSLPVGLPAGERGFLKDVSSGDSEILKLVRKLESYFDTTSLDPGPSCEVALIPDSALLGGPFRDNPLVVVPSMPTPKNPPPDPKKVEDQEEKSEEEILYDKAVAAKSRARNALKDAIYAKALRHTAEKIEDGHKELEVGINLLVNSNGKRAKRATKKFEKAEQIFIRAKETADRIEHMKPKVRVH